MCRPCTNKLYTCNKIKTDFIEANNKLQEYFRFTKSSGIQFLDLQPVASAHQTSNEVAEVQSVSQVVKPFVSKSDVQLVSQVMTDREQLMSDIPSDVIYGAINTSNKDLLKGKEIILNCIDKFSINVEECVISCTDNEATFHGNLTQNKSDPAGNTLNACDTKVEKVEPRNKKYKYVCGECEEMFTVKGALRKHKRTHFRVVFECDYCNKEFTQRNQLNDHRRIHTKELPFMCEICGKCFRTSMNLNSHKYVHKPPSYTCQVCSKKFSSSICLAQHKKVHCTDMQLMCEVCGKMLYTPFSLKIHLRRHTGEKPFRCSACGKCFTAGARLKKHRLIHADRKF
jgi:stress-induced morphogen